MTAAIDLENDRQRRGGLRTTLAKVNVSNREDDKARLQVESAYRDIRNPVGEGPVGRPLYAAWCWIVGLLSLVIPWRFSGLRGSGRARLLRRWRLYRIATQVAFFSQDTARLIDLVVRQVYTGAMLGAQSAHRALAYCVWAAFLSNMGLTRAPGRFINRALAIAEHVEDRIELAWIRMAAAHTLHSSGDPRGGELAMRRCIQQDGPWLDATDWIFAHTDLSWNLMMRGYSREALECLEAASARHELHSGETLDLSIRMAGQLAVLGRGAEARNRIAPASDLVSNQAARWPLGNYLSHQLLIHLELGEHGEPVEELLASYARIRPRPRLSPFYGRHFYVCQAFLRLAQCDEQPTPLQLDRLREAIRALRKCSQHPTLRAHLLAVVGAAARLEGDPVRSLRILVRGELVALQSDNRWAQFEIRRQMAHTLSALGNLDSAVAQARLAHRLAVEHGWTNRARAIRSEFDVLRPPGAGAPRHLVDAPSGQMEATRLEQHLEALLQVSLAASSTLDPIVQARLALDEIIRVLHAQRAFLFTCSVSGELDFRAGRNDAGDDLPELTGYSRSVVETVRTSCEPLVVSGSEEGEVQASASIIAHDLRSIIAAPLLIGGRLVGVVYLDSQHAYGAFNQDDVSILLAIANHIAIALDLANAVARQAVLTQANADLLDVLQDRIEELRESRRQITAAEERLRREIAEMLHSRVQSKLLVAGHQLGRVQALMDTDEHAAKKLLAETQNDIDEIREREIRNASHLLHPSIIRVGLIPAVRSLLGRFEDFFRVSLEVDPALARIDNIVENELPEDLRLTAYRCVEEALNNIQRHARARLAEIKLQLLDGHELGLLITDDGQGFDSSQHQAGLGLHSIGGRVSQLGGTWQLTSEVGQGTRLEIRLPLVELAGSGSPQGR